MRKLMLSLFLLGITVYSANAQLAWGGRVGLCYATISAEGETI